MAWIHKPDGTWVWQDESGVATMTPDSMLESTQPDLQTTPYSFNNQTTTPVTDAPVMTTDMGEQYGQWVAEGGSGDWESFRQSLIQRGRPDPGAYSPNKIPG